jgi:RimJ/RimL family protein N-acetyltransferase
MRPWRAADAGSLLPVLEANRDHLAPWIPKHVSEPAHISVLEQRLAGFDADFAADKAWRFALFTVDRGETLGELGMFPRSAAGRVSFADADRVEIGYWLRADFTGRGLIAEAARAAIAISNDIPRFSHLEIRCDARNTASVAVAKRLGFSLTNTVFATDEPSGDGSMQVWAAPLGAAGLRLV